MRLGSAAMRRVPSTAAFVAACAAFAAVAACERRPIPVVGDAATTSASPLAREQAVGDAATTSALVPVEEQLVVREQVLERREDAGVLPAPVAAGVDAGLPRWVPRDAPLTIVPAFDRDRNLGITTSPAPPQRLTVDAGGVEVEIEIRRPP